MTHQKRLLAIARDKALSHHDIVSPPPDDTPTYATASGKCGSRSSRGTRLLVVQGERGGSTARALDTSRRQASSAGAGVAASRTATVTPTAAPWPTWPRPARFAYAAVDVPPRYVARTSTRRGFSIGRMSGEGQSLTCPTCRAYTRELAHRGADQAGSGDPVQTAQHLALVLDDRIVSTPFINWREAPDGIDGADGAYMSGLPTPEQARLTAALLSAGPLPGTLQLIRR